jgi:hypothetical protein
MKQLTEEHDKSNNSNLDLVEREINELHPAVVEAARKALDMASRVGKLLLMKQCELKYEEWPLWLIGHVPFAGPVARYYIEAFRNQHRFESASDADVMPAFHFLSQPQPKEDATSMSDEYTEARVCPFCNKLGSKLYTYNEGMNIVYWSICEDCKIRWPVCSIHGLPFDPVELELWAERRRMLSDYREVPSHA